MSTNDNITIEISTTDVDLTSEMDVQSTQTSQIDEPNTLASVETEKVTTSISTRSENKTDETTAALMQLLLIFILRYYYFISFPISFLL